MNARLVKVAAVVLALVTLPWAMLVLFWADFDHTSFWDGDCSTNDPVYSAIVVGTGLAGIAVALTVAFRSFRRPTSRSWLALAGVLTIVTAWTVISATAHPEQHSLPADACTES